MLLREPIFTPSKPRQTYPYSGKDIADKHCFPSPKIPSGSANASLSNAHKHNLSIPTVGAIQDFDQVFIRLASIPSSFPSRGHFLIITRHAFLSRPCRAHLVKNAIGIA